MRFCNNSFRVYKSFLCWSVIVNTSIVSAETVPLKNDSQMTTQSLSTIDKLEAVAGNSSVLVSNVPEIKEELKQRVGQYLNARSAQLLDICNDGKCLLISTRFGNTSQLHLLDKPLGARFQLTFSDEPISRGKFHPTNKERIFFGQDVGGGENFQIFEFDRLTGKSRMLSDGKSRYSLPVFSPDGKYMAFSNNARNGRDTDVFFGGIPGTKQDASVAVNVTETTGTWGPIGFSPNSRKLLIQQFRAIDDSDLYFYDIANKSLELVSPKDGKGSISDAEFSADGKFIYVVTDRYSDFNQIYRIDFDNRGAKPEPVADSIQWNVEGIAVEPETGNLVFSVNEDGISNLYVADVEGNQAVRKLTTPTGVLGNLKLSKALPGQAFFSKDTPESPNDIYSISLVDEKITRWTQSEVGGLNTEDFVQPQLVRYPSTEGVVVPAFYYPAATKESGKKSPIVVIFHGGPEGQSRPNFSPFIQYLVKELGYGILLPNVRGSDGYGKHYLSLDNGILRENSLSDIGATLDWIKSQPEVDENRVAVFGGSYGGYMVLSAITRYPEKIKAAVDVVGVSHIVTFLQNTLEYRRDLRRVEYGDERDPKVREVQERISPLNYVDKIQAALFVQHGKNDPRVPQSEAEQIVRAVRANNHPCWYMLALNEGHGFAKKENRDYSLFATVQFLIEQLGSTK